MKILPNNIKHLRLQNGLTQEDLAEKMGISGSRLANYEQGIREIPLDILVKIAAHFSMALDVLVKVDLTKVDSKSIIKVGENRLLFPISVDMNNIPMVEIVPFKASAGYLTGFADPEFIDTLPKMMLPFLNHDAGTYRGFQIEGDSMLPLKHGTYIVGKYVESLLEIKNGRTYIVHAKGLKENGLVYKRLFNRIKQEGVVFLHSDNKLYQPYPLHPEDILEIWEFKCFFCLEEYAENEFNMENFGSTLLMMKNDIASIKSKLL